MKVATGLAIGNKALPELAAQAVLAAMEKAQLDSPACVLLFLTSEFASQPQLAIKAAAKAASCMQIIGCSSIGIFTEEDWVIDSPAAAAMVFSENIWLKPPKNTLLTKESTLLTLTAPNAINSLWLDSNAVRFGGVSGDAIGHGSFSVWENAKGITQGLCEMQLSNMDCAVGATHGLKLITSPRRITACNQHDIIHIANLSALSVLKSAWNKHAPINETSIPYHRLMAVHATRASHIEHGDYSLTTIITGDEASGAVTLAKPLQVGDWVSWAVRDIDAAQVDLVKTATQLKQQLSVKPRFSLLFSNLGRGPYFYDGIDQDLALIRTLFPHLPLIGFYGNGEIAPILGNNTLLQYSAVLGLFGVNMALFNPTRDEVREFFFGTWAKLKAQQTLTDLEKLGLNVMQMHPEYHAILNAPEHYKQVAYYPEMGETNPFLHMSLHLSILEQISINQPIGIAPIYEQLKIKHQNAHDALHDILDCLAETIWLAQRNNTGLDSAHYLKLLQQKAGLNHV